MSSIELLLSQLDSSFGVRIGITAVIIVGFILYLVSCYRWRRSLLNYFDTRFRRVGLLVIFASVSVSTGSLLVITWGVSDSLISAFADGVRTNILAKILTTIVVLIITYLLTGLLDSIIKRIFTEEGRQVVDEHRREVIFRVTQMTFYLLVGIAILNFWNIDIGSILVGAGALAAIIGLSARHTLSAAIAGVILLFSRPFKVGDWIEVGEQEGTVKRITIVTTILNTPDDEEIVIPNDVISEKSINNKSTNDKVRLSVNVGIPYECDVDEATRIIESATKKCGIIAEIPEPTSRVDSFGNSSVNIKTYYWIRNPSPRRKIASQSVIRKNIKKELNKNGIEIPYPKRDINTSVNSEDAIFSTEQEEVEGNPEEQVEEPINTN